MHIGLIGGIGPAATVVYYQRLVEAFRALDRPLDLTIVNAEVKTLAANAAADDRAAQARVYAGLLERLKGAGADFATISSLGGHFCYAETLAVTPLPLVSAIDPIDGWLAGQAIRTVGILGTRQVMQSRLFGQLTRTAAVLPDDIDAVHEAYIASATTGACTDDRRSLFFAQGRKMIAAGADAVLLAGTDLGLAFDGRDPGFPTVDALDIHVEYLVDLATGRVGLPD